MQSSVERLRRALLGIVALGGVAVLWGSASAADSEPRLYFINALPGPVQLSIDGKAVGPLRADSAYTAPLTPGEHVMVVTSDDGSSISKPYVFDKTNLAQVGKSSWWCVAMAPRTEGSPDGFLFQMPAERCKAYVPTETAAAVQH